MASKQTGVLDGLDRSHPAMAANAAAAAAAALCLCCWPPAVMICVRVTREADLLEQPAVGCVFYDIWFSSAAWIGLPIVGFHRRPTATRNTKLPPHPRTQTPIQMPADRHLCALCERKTGNEQWRHLLPL